jgi:hypothetical protein
MSRSIKVVLCAVVLGVSSLSLPGPAAAEDCGGSSMAAQILKNHQDKLKALGCKNDADCIAKRNEIVDNGKAFWNSMAGNSWAAIGPRELTLGEELKGTVINPGERRFLSALPIIDYDTVKLTLTKKGGQAETDVRIYRLDAQGNCAELATVTVPKGDGSFAQTFTLSAVRGSVLTVRLTPKGLGRKLEYTLLAKGQ